MAKRITNTTIKWKELEQRVPPEQKGNFFAFKGKSEGYLRRMLSSPAAPPKIDWEVYKKQVPVPGLVEKFQSAYTSYKIPYPEDKLSASVDKQWSELQAEIAKFVQDNKGHIAAACLHEREYRGDIIRGNTWHDDNIAAILSLVEKAPNLELIHVECVRKHRRRLAEKEIARIEALPKFEDMTMEMVRDMFPDSALDCVNRPTFWPHTDDEQLGYTSPTTKV